MRQLPRLEKIKAGFYRFNGQKQNLKIIRRKGKWFVDQYSQNGDGSIGPYNTLTEAYKDAEIETESRGIEYKSLR